MPHGGQLDPMGRFLKTPPRLPKHVTLKCPDAPKRNKRESTLITVNNNTEKPTKRRLTFAVPPA
jgi:hypothetical protein